MCKSTTSNQQAGRVERLEKKGWFGTWSAAIVIGLLAFLPSIDYLLTPDFPVHSTGSVVISGTSSGIGRATCGHLAEQYPDVTFYCGVRKPSAAEGYPFDLANVKSVILDVTKQEDVEAAISNIESPLIGIVANAGIAALATVEFQPWETIQKVFDVNVFGTLRLTRSALPALRENKGRVVWISSISGLSPATPLFGTYASTKFAVEGYGDALRRELHALEVSVSLVEPGFVPSEMTQNPMLKDEEPVEGSIEYQEAQAYPKMMDPDFTGPMQEMISLGFPVDETCKAIEHALFSTRPKPRYLTAGVGLVPSWIFVRMTNLIPSFRLQDRTALDPKGMKRLVKSRKNVDKLLGKA